MMDANAFNFDAMKEAVGVDPFAQVANKYARDERFYTLTKDKEGNGAALVRFLPDKEKGMIQKMFKINTTVTKNGKKRFVSEFSPSTIGQPCPFQETWQQLWNEDRKEESKLYSRGVRFVTNIKIIKDPANPENEGKIFLYEMSGAMKDKVQNAVDPSEQDRALGAIPKELFNPLRGNSFRLVAKKGANGQINYDSSEVVSAEDSIYESVEAALEDLKTNAHPLSDLLKPEAFMSYDELVSKQAWVTFTEGGSTPAAAAVVVPLVAAVSPPATPASSEVLAANVVTAAVVSMDDAVMAAEAAVVPTPPAALSTNNLDSLLAGLI